MAKKGGKASKGKGPSKPKPKKEGGPGSSKGESFLEELASLPPQERIASVKPFWESLGQAEREALLTVDLGDLREYAAKVTKRLRKQAAAEAAAAAQTAGGEEVTTVGPLAGAAASLEPALDELLEEALRRSGDKGTWKVWQWPSAGADFYDSEAFRRYLESELTPGELRRLLPSREAAAAAEQQEEGVEEEGGRGGQPQQEEVEEEEVDLRGERAANGGDEEGGNRADISISSSGGTGKKGEGGDGSGSAAKDKAAAAANKPVEKPAEAALRLRMADLLQRVHAMNRAAQEEDAQYRRPALGRRGGAGGAGADAHAAAAGGVRDVNVELITLMMSALEKEHEFLYQLVLYPLTTYLAELLPEGARDSSRTELFFEDLEKLPPEEVARMCEWLTEKLDSFSSKLKPEAKELLETVGDRCGGTGGETTRKWGLTCVLCLLGLPQQDEDEEEPIGDVDLFCLTHERGALTVHPKWLTHLQERQLGEDGQPRKVKSGEDPHRMGLVLEWVYGTIVSTAEKARDGAKRALGSRIPQVEPAHEQLVTHLRDLAAWDARARAARELLAEMVASRKEATQMVARHNIKPYQPPEKKAADEQQQQQLAAPEDAAREAEAAVGAGALPGAPPAAEDDYLPDAVVLSMLRREVLLTRAKLHYLGYQQLMAERMLRSLKAQLRQGEPEFDRLKREVEEVKNAHRGLDGTYRTAAEMERHRAQLADAAIEEQIEVQTAFREQGQRLQRIYDHRRETELAMARREQEMKQLSNWKSTVAQIIGQLEDNLKLSAPLQQLTDDVDVEAQGPDTDATRALVEAVQSVTQQSSQLSRLRAHFHKDLRRQLYGDEDDVAFFDIIKKQLKEIEKRLEDGRAALQHVENFVVNVACDDPGAAVGAQLVLPLLQERLDARALEFAAQRAEQAQQEVMRMEAERAERERQEREKKSKQKQKAKEKLRSEKERERAEREERERAQQQEKLQEQQQRQQQEEEERRRRADELEALRRAEEELMERRRQELLADEGSHWRQRMEAERLIAAQAQLELGLSQQALATELSDSANEAEHQDALAASSGGRELKRRPGAPRRRGASAGGAEGSGEEGSGSRPYPRRQQQHPQAGGAASSGGMANGYLHGHGGANGHLERPHRGDGTSPHQQQQQQQARFTGRPGRDSAPRYNHHYQAQQGQQEVRGRQMNPPGRPPSSQGGPANHSHLQQQQQHTAAAREQRRGEPAQPSNMGSASPQDEHAAAAAAGARGLATGVVNSSPEATGPAPGPSDFPPLVAAAAAPVAQQPQQEAVPAPVQEEPALPAGAVAAAQPGRQAPYEAGQQEPQQAEQQAPTTIAPTVPAPQAPALSVPPSTTAATPQAVGPGGPAVPAAAPQQPTPDPAAAQPRGLPSVAPGVLAAVPAALVAPAAVPLPPPMVPVAPAPVLPPAAAAVLPAVGPPALGMPPPLPGPPLPLPRPVSLPAAEPPRQQAQQQLPPGRERSSSRGLPAEAAASSADQPASQQQQQQQQQQQGLPPVLPMPMPGMQLPPPHYAGPPFGPMGHPPPGHLPIMYFPAPHMPPGPGPPPQMVVPGRGGAPRPGGPFVPLPAGMFPLVPLPMMQPVPMQAIPFGPGPGGARPQRTRSSGLRVNAPAFVPSGQQQQQQQGGARRANLAAPDRPRSEGALSPRDSPQAAPVGASNSHGTGAPQPAPASAPGSAGSHSSASVVFPSNAVADGVAGSPRGPLEQPSLVHKAAATLGAAVPVRPAGDEGLSSSASDGSSSGDQVVLQQQQHPQAQQPQQGFQLPPLPTTTEPRRGGQPTAGASTLPAATTQQEQRQGGASSLVAPSSTIPSSSSNTAISPSSSTHRAPPPPPQRTPQQAGRSSEAPGGAGLLPRAQVAQQAQQEQRPHQQLAQQQQQQQAQRQAKAAAVEPSAVDLEGLRLVRGMTNAPGAYNCFLNVVVQCLWHLAPFRTALLELPAPDGLEARGGAPADVHVMQALWTVFRAMAGGDMPQQQQAQQQQQQQQQRSRRPPVSAAPLREALSGLRGGAAAAAAFELSEMHDAAEVLGELFDSMHRAQLGAAAAAAGDPTLPRRVRVPAGTVAALLSRPAGRSTAGAAAAREAVYVSDRDPALPGSSPPRAAAPTIWGNGAALAKVKQAPALQQSAGSLHSEGLVMRLFGQEVQILASPDKGGGAGDQQAASSAAAPSAPGGSSTVEVLQFVKYFHLVPAAGLRAAFEAAQQRGSTSGSGAPFETLLLSAEAGGGGAAAGAVGIGSASKGGAGGFPGGQGAPTPQAKLLRRPQVLALGIVWESPQAPIDAIAATMQAIGTELDAGGLYVGDTSGPSYSLRCLMCYHRNHYQAFALSQEAGCWLRFDDDKVAAVGPWPAVVAALVGGRMQPSVLFYEAPSPAGRAGPAGAVLS
ncbi:hypothetical protein N2152v2_001841 [Parachlorella kessleri]